MATDSTVLGVFIIIRHGDRAGFYQDPLTYTASNTVITPLGNDEEYQLGSYIRSIYLNASSPSFISGLSTGLFDPTQVTIRADTGDEGGVIYDSTVSLTQGLWSPTTNNSVLLANGTTVTAPLNGYQYVPVQSVGLDQIALEGWTDCTPFNDATSAFYNSALFKQVAAASQPFLSELPPYLDGRNVTLENMWNIFDFMNVQSIHNATFANALPATFLEQARALANFHEYGVFSSPQLNGIGNIGGQAILPDLLNGFAAIVNASNPVKFFVDGVSYKPFISLFNMTDVAQNYEELAGIVEYAAAVAYEVRQSPSDSEPMIRFNFKNGTAATEFTTYNLFGASGDIPLSEFIDNLAPYAINSTQDWCNICQNTQDRGCAALTLAAENAAPHQRISPVGAGFLGAGLTVAVFIILLIALGVLGFISLGSKQTKSKKSLLMGRTNSPSVNSNEKV